MVAVSVRPFEAKIILFKFFLSEVGKMSCSIHGGALTLHLYKNCKMG